MKNTFFLIGIGGWAHDSSLDDVNDAPKKIIGVFSNKTKLNSSIKNCDSKVHERGHYNYLVVEKVSADKLQAGGEIVEFYKLNGKFSKVKVPKWASKVKSFVFDN